MQKESQKDAGRITRAVRDGSVRVEAGTPIIVGWDGTAHLMVAVDAGDVAELLDCGRRKEDGNG